LKKKTFIIILKNEKNGRMMNVNWMNKFIKGANISLFNKHSTNIRTR